MLILTILFSITPQKAAFTSLFLPGSGDLLQGRKKRAAMFIAAESAIWISYFGFKWREGTLNNSAKNFAHLYSGAIKGSDDDYYTAVENYRTSEAYNEYIREQARIEYPDTTDPEILENRKEYIKNNTYTGEEAWDWESQSKFDEFDEIRDNKRNYAQKARNMIGIAVANRVANFFVNYLTDDRVEVRIDKNKVELGVRF